MRPVTRIVLATTALALLHSALASRTAKAGAARLVGERNRNAFYRPFFNAQSVVTFGGLTVYIKRQPDRPIWRTGRAAAVAMNSIRLAALLGMVSAARQIGLRRLLGLAGVQAWWQGSEAVPSEPEAQGPALDKDQAASGVFRFTRHPLNFLAVLLIWMTPRMNRNRLAFNLLATVYFVLGSWHEEHRLQLAYGDKYERYKRKANFLVGRKRGSGDFRHP